MNKANTTILSTAYFPPIEYFYYINNSTNIIIETNENYTKQSFRNRCSILAANGKLDISVPIIKNHNKKTLIKDTKISYDTNWQKMHWKSIESAYNSSAFYEYYIDDFVKFFTKKYNFLLDYNIYILETLFEALNWEVEIKFSEDYHKTYDRVLDYRHSIHPKLCSEYKSKQYFQVFSDKYKFIPNLSIIDLLFNEGTNAEYYL